MVDVNLKVPAIEKLLDYAASGVGAVAGPMLLPWRAHWEGKAKRISARADADVQSIRMRPRKLKHCRSSPQRRLRHGST